MSDLYKDWEKFSSAKMKSDDLDGAYFKVKSAIEKPERRQRRVYRYLFAAAAAICLFAIPYASIKTYCVITDVPQAEVSLCQVVTHNGEIRTIILPDSTSVVLNAGSTLIYPENFGGEKRSVYLVGEAVFDVTENKDVPFVVNTADFAVNVHGTVFNVNAYPDNKVASATLCSGSISAVMNESGKTVEMAPNQRLQYNRPSKSYELVNVDAPEFTSWQKKEMCFNGESIHDIAHSIERGFDVNVYVTSGRYDNARITAKFLHGETLDEMMSAICLLVPDMNYSIVNSNVYIK